VLCFHELVEFSLQPLTDVLDQANSRLRGGAHAAARIWPTGFDALDRNLSGGFRSGELILLAGAQGLGKTTWALQAARNIALSGRSVLFLSFEHDPQAVLVRLVALEAGLVAGTEAPTIGQIRSEFEILDARRGATLADRLDEYPGGGKALATVESYAERMVVHRSTGSSTTLDTIRDAVEEVRHQTGQLPIVFVDYLQKVKVPQGPSAEDDRVTVVVEGLKDLSLDYDIPVMAIVAADKAGLEAGKRMRVNNLRGSSALAYEADTVLILNNKFDVVARHHLVYNTGSAERFKQWAVLTIEKNRSGKDGIDLEFQKRFELARFEPEGQVVVEKLVDERIFVE
jgi:replicative DNA helicase